MVTADVGACLNNWMLRYIKTYFTIFHDRAQESRHGVGDLRNS